MATNYNPAIVTDGLVMCCDAANSKSYPGSGTTFIDVSGNGNDGSLNNSPTHDTEGGGCFEFDANTERIVIPIDLQNNQFTVMGFARYTTSSGNGRVISSHQGNWLMGWYANNTSYYVATGGWVFTGNGGHTTDWICVAATGDTAAENWKLYRNGVLIRNHTASGFTGPNGITLGGWGNGSAEASNCKVAYVNAYRRVLTDAEVKQNYNALKGRFGL